jgi:hypothetical protein
MSEKFTTIDDLLRSQYSVLSAQRSRSSFIPFSSIRSCFYPCHCLSIPHENDPNLSGPQSSLGVLRQSHLSSCAFADDERGPVFPKLSWKFLFLDTRSHTDPCSAQRADDLVDKEFIVPRRSPCPKRTNRLSVFVFSHPVSNDGKGNNGKGNSVKGSRVAELENYKTT